MPKRKRPRKERPQRVPRDWERPGAVIKAPPITVTRECGEKRELAYGGSGDVHRGDATGGAPR